MRLLIVDGYNVIHSWPELKSALDRGGLEESRSPSTGRCAGSR